VFEKLSSWLLCGYVILCWRLRRASGQSYPSNLKISGYSIEPEPQLPLPDFPQTPTDRSLNVSKTGKSTR